MESFVRYLDVREVTYSESRITKTKTWKTLVVLGNKETRDFIVYSPSESDARALDLALTERRADWFEECMPAIKELDYVNCQKAIWGL